MRVMPVCESEADSARGTKGEGEAQEVTAEMVPSALLALPGSSHELFLAFWLLDNPMLKKGSAEDAKGGEERTRHRSSR